MNLEEIQINGFTGPVYRVPFVDPIWDFALMKIWTDGNIFTMLPVLKKYHQEQLFQNRQEITCRGGHQIYCIGHSLTHTSVMEIFVWYVKDTSWTVLGLRPK